MSSLQDLNDPHKTCVYLPPHEVNSEEPSLDATFDSSQDLYNDDYNLRLEAYRAAWMKCLERVQAIVHTLHVPVVSAVTKSVLTAHKQSDILPGLPYPELPVVAVSAAGGSNTIITDIVNSINGQSVSDPKGKRKATSADEENAPYDTLSKALVTHVYPTDCANVTSAMKAIIGGFVDRDDSNSDEKTCITLPTSVKRKATTSLANYDVNLLRAWYDALNALNNEPPILVVVLHDFEKVDPHIMQDVFYILNQHILSLPVVFLLSMSTPSPAAYLHSAFPRATLALLRLQVHAAPAGKAIIEEVIEQTFFSLHFQPTVAIGSGILDFLGDFCSRHTPMLDATLSILQIAHLKHFEEPLAIFAHDTNLGKSSRTRKHPLHNRAKLSFVEALLAQLHDRITEGDDMSDGNLKRAISQSEVWDNASVDELVRMTDEAREESHRRCLQLRLGYQVYVCARKALQEQGIKSSVPGIRNESALEFMSRVVRGRVARDINHITLAVKKLSDAQLELVLSALYSLLYSLPSHLRQETRAPREFIARIRSNLSSGEDEMHEDEADPAFAVGEWLKEYLSTRMVRLDEGPLWFIWNTGAAPFPSELINPAPRMTVVNALLHPHDVSDEFEVLFTDKKNETEHSEPELCDMPDTSILFRRYMEAGKTINVYDLYDAFGQVLDTQRRKLARQQTKDSPGRKSKGKGKGKGRAKQSSPNVQRDVEIEDLTEAEQEQWQAEVHARFIRALHELDFMGFIKHTKRKADHVIRTIYDIPD